MLNVGCRPAATDPDVAVPVSPADVCVEVSAGAEELSAAELLAGAWLEDAGAWLVGAGAVVVGSGIPLLGSPLMSALLGSGSFGVPASTVFMNSCQICPGRPDP
jgi:hypothetical protein